MPATVLTSPSAAPAPTSLVAKLLNVLASPGGVFDEVLDAPIKMANWRVPTLLVGLAGIFLLQIVGAREHGSAVILLLTGPWPAFASEAELLAGGWPLVSSVVVCLAAFTGTLWSAFVLWFIGRIFLKVRFSFLKTLEIVGLSGTVLALGSLVTILLIAASGDAAARPSLSLLAGKLVAAHPVRQALEALNFFHLWSAMVLAIGLSRLGGVSFKEAAFWVFGYWVLVRLALIILA